MRRDAEFLCRGTGVGAPGSSERKHRAHVGLVALGGMRVPPRGWGSCWAALSGQCRGGQAGGQDRALAGCEDSFA